MMVMIIWPRQIDTYWAIICSEASGFDYELGVSFVRCNHLSSKYQGPKRLTEMQFNEDVCWFIRHPRLSCYFLCLAPGR